MKKVFILRSLDVMMEAHKYITSLPLEPLMKVTVEEYKANRSLLQNSLYWVWCTFIAEKIGETKEGVHERNKEKHLVKLFERDNPEYAAMIQTVRTVFKKGMQKEALHLRKEIIRLTSTTDANVKQMTEYLNDIEKDYSEQGIILPHPEDLYYESLR